MLKNIPKMFNKFWKILGKYSENAWKMPEKCWKIFQKYSIHSGKFCKKYSRNVLCQGITMDLTFTKQSCSQDMVSIQDCHSNNNCNVHNNFIIENCLYCKGA